MAKNSIEVLRSIAGSKPEKTTVKPGEEFTQHKADFLGVIPLFRRTTTPLKNGKFVTANTYFGFLRSGVTREATREPRTIGTPIDALALRSVSVQKSEEKRRTYSVL